MMLAIAMTAIRPSRWALVTNLPARSLVQVVDVALGPKASLTHAVEYTSYRLTFVGLSCFVTIGISSTEAPGASDQAGQGDRDDGRDADNPECYCHRKRLGSSSGCMY